MATIDFAGFLKRYNVSILNDQKKILVLSQPFDFYATATIQNSVVRHERAIVLEIPKHRLNDLSMIESIFFNNQPDGGGRHIFDRWCLQQRDEQELRSESPAVKSAYEHYLMTLELAREKPIRVKIPV